MFFKALIIGASTGGPSALRNILKLFPKQFPIPIIILQRIPPGLFAESLAEALDEVSKLNVRILKEDDQLNFDEAVLVPGGHNIYFENNKINLIKGSNLENSPSISHTLKQTLTYFNGPILVTILTGICLDNDLVEIVKTIKEKNGVIVVQNPESCFIGDLPQTIIQAGLADHIYPLETISTNIIDLANKE